MSHELRTPLNAILGFAQVLEMDGLDLVQQASVDQILKGGRHLLTLINEVLDLSGIESGHLTISPEPVDVGTLVEEVIALVDSVATQYGVTLDPWSRPECHQYVLADQQRLKQVLLNLLANAIKYNRPGGSVRVSCGAAPENRVRLEVRDTGAGIPAEQLPRLFTPFDRLDAEQTMIEGTGLGLALAKRLMEAMDGSIGVDSMVGVGSTFWIDLPLAAALIDQVDGIPGHASRIPEEPLPPVQPARILLSIEDNLANLRLMERVLSHRPELALLTAMEGHRGLELAKEHHPDLILLDLHLPDIQGDEILHALQADPATHETPVIMLSADANPRRRAELLAAGATAYLTKPLDIAQFLAVVDDTLATLALKGC
jgi:CheY-like chemotaxis protein/anti-sigma regulatory factor (Ser/Thr protein kinase)